MKKKLLSAILASIMIFSQAAIVIHAEEKEEIYARDIEIMTSLGLFDKLEGKDEDSIVTRAEFAAAAADLLNLKTSDGTTWFKDVTKEHSLYASVSAAAQAGIIQGDNGNFYPDKEITYKEAATVLVNVLGYKDHARLEESYTKIAESVGIKKKITAAEDSAVTVGIAARMFLNSGNAEIVVPTFSGSDVVLKKGDTLFSQKHDISEGKGIFTANQYAAIDGGTPAAKNTVRIGNFSGTIYYNYAETEYLGYNVEYYAKEMDGENVICYLAPIDSKNEITIVSSADFEDFDTVNSVFSYEEDGKIRKQNIASDTWIVYNGKITAKRYYDDNGTKRSIFDIDNGELKFIDNNGDGRPEVVSIFAYENYFVSAVDLIKQELYDTYDANKVINFEETEKPGRTWNITDKKGNLINFEKISEKSVLSIAASEDGELLRGIVSEEKISGQISTIKNEYGKYMLVIGGEEHELCRSYTDYNSDLPAVGANAMVYLDYEGKAAGILIETSDSGYAFLMKVIYDDIEEIYSLKLLTQDGVKGNFRLAKSVKIDGEKYKDEGLKAEMQNYKDYRVIRYKLNSDNEVTMIDTTTENTKGDTDKLRELKSMGSIYYYDTVMYFGNGELAIDSDTVIFETPPEESKTSYDLYKIGSVSGFGVKYYVAGYTSDDKGFVCEALHKQSSGGSTDFTGKQPCVLITDINYTIDEDDIPVTVIKGYSWSKGEDVELTFATDCTYEKVNTPNGINDLNVGEIIMYSTNAEGRIAYFEAMKKLDKTGLLGRFTNTSTYGLGSGDFGCTWGYIISRSNDLCALVKTKKQLYNDIKPDAIVKITDRTQIYYVSADSRTQVSKIAKTNLGVLADYKHSSRITEIVCLGNNAQVNMLVVYELRK